MRRIWRLATIVHISDLHFGRVDPQTLDARAPRLWAKCKQFDGLLGHSYKSLVRLEQTVAKLRAKGYIVLAITGDLTAMGHGEEFRSATEYLGDVLSPPKGDHLGLRDPEWDRLCVPGNHDHWPGTPTIFGGPSSDFETCFKKFPRQFAFRLGSGFRLRFLSINTDADVSPYGSSRALGRGSFMSQLAKLAAILEPPSPENPEIRAILLHHSYSAQGRTLVMNSSSKAALHDFIVDHDVSVLMCGHIHQPPSVSVLQASHLKRTVDFIEARCGTTTQMSTMPYNWTNLLGQRPKREDHWPNTMLIHRLFTDGDAVEWETETLIERPWGFDSAVNALSGDWGAKTFQVWPR